MSNKITITTEKDGRDIVFEGSGTLTLVERAGRWADTRPLSKPSREVRGVEIEWDGIYTVREAVPLSLKDMEVAWENADATIPVHVGDTIIQRDPVGESFSVFKAERDYPHPPFDIRILRRAREPWQALADVLGTNGGELIGEHRTITEVAKALHERGVRVMGGDDDE